MFVGNPWIEHTLDADKRCTTCGTVFASATDKIYTNTHGMTMQPHPDVPLTPTISCQGGSK